MRTHVYLRETKAQGGGALWKVLIAGLFLFFLPSLRYAHLPFSSTAQVISLAQAPNGHFYANAIINGVPLRVMVDSGATFTTIPVALANRLNLGPLVFNQTVSTANGPVRGAETTLREVTISGVTFRNVEGLVTVGILDVPLLGQSFLSGLQSYHVENRTMTLSYGGRP